MPLLFEKLVQEDLNVGTDTVWVQAPGGGKLLSTRVGMHSFARGQVEYESAWTPGAITAGSKVSTTVTVPNAAVADYVWASHDKVLTSDLRISSHVSAANTVKVVIHNPTTSSVTVAAGTLRVLVFGPLAASPPAAPTVNITSPSTGALGGLSVLVQTTPSDPVFGIANVKIYWQYCPGSVCGASTLVATVTSAPYNATWTFPTCGACPQDRFRISAVAENNNGNTSSISAVDVRLTGRGC